MPDVTVQTHVDDFMVSANASAARTAIGAAALASPTFTGVPAAPTAAGGTNTTQLATTGFVQQELASKSYVDGEVTNYADLPVTVGTPAVGSIYIVKRWTLANPLSFPGQWERRFNNGNLADWERLGGMADMFADAYFTIFDDSDSTKRIRFSAGGITTGQTREYQAPDKNGTLALRDDIKKVVGIVIDGAGSAVSTGVKGYIRVPWAGTITKVTVLADQSGSIVIDVWKDTYANYPPTVADTITASAKPTLSSAIKSEDSTLTGWTTSVTAGDAIGFNVDSAATVTRVTLELEVTLT